jgi:ABC-type transport system involved in multi-copper enzyme maturation permease subunit
MGSLAIARLSVVETLRRKEFYVVLVLVFGLAAWMCMLNLGSSGAGRFAKDIVMQAIWLASFALAVPLAVRQVSSDVEQKTVYVLVSRPIHRWHYVVGRAVGASAASVLCFASMFAVLVLMLSVKGAASIADPGLWQAFVLQVIALVMLCSLAVCFSVVATPGGAVTFSLILLLVMRYGGASILSKIDRMPAVSREVAWAVYLALPHFEFFNISQRVVHGWGALPANLFVGSLVYGFACSVFFTALAAIIFRKRWL